MLRMDQLHLEMPFAGARMLRDKLRLEGYHIGRKHAATLMRRMGLEALYRKPNLSNKHPKHKIYPYLLRGVNIERANHVWCADISYIPMRHGFMYLFAILDWATRRVLAWRLSNTLTTDFCIEALENAFMRYGTPEIFNTDHVLYAVVKRPRSQKRIQPAIAGPYRRFRAAPLLVGFGDNHNKNTRSELAFTVPNTSFGPSGGPKHDLRGRCRLKGSSQRGSPARYRQLVKAAIVNAGLKHAVHDARHLCSDRGIRFAL